MTVLCAGALGGQIQPMFEEPHQGLTGAAELSDLVEHHDNRFLHAAIGSLLDPVPNLHEAHRGCHNEFATAGFLIAGRERMLAQKIEFVLIEASLQPQQQPVVALTRCIDRLLVDQHGVDDSAHLNELLPATAVAGKPDTSRAATAPTLPRQTSATPPAAERPRSSSIVSMRDQPSAVRRSRIAY